MDADIDGSRSMFDGADLNDAIDSAAQDAIAPVSDLSIDADETPLTDTGASDDAGQVRDAGERDAADDSNTATCPPAGLDCDGIPVHPRNAANRFPIVFVHGMGGFENIGRVDYYFQVPERLRRNGYGVHVTVTDPFNSSEVRTDQLAPQIDRILACTCELKVNIIAHSQGGIDARLLISGRGYGDRVASLSTISTPHRGTPLADVMLGLTDGPSGALLETFARIFSPVIWDDPANNPNVRAAMTSCSTQAMAEFNEAYPDHPDVAYYSYAGFSGVLADGRPECDGAELDTPRRGDVLPPELLASFTYLGGILNANDGLIPVTSARWGRFRGCVAADHLDEIGQIGGLVDRFDYQRFYLELVEFLSDEGY